MLRILASTAFLLVAACSAASEAAERITGHACVLSGNLLELPCGGADRVRLFGIDAPELAQTCTLASGTEYPCGEVAAGVLREMIGEAHAVCEVRGQDFYGRPVVVCRVGKVNLNAAMVRRGWAVSYRGTNAYADQEAAAKAEKRGIWAGKFDEPRKWRQATTGKEE